MWRGVHYPLRAGESGLFGTETDAALIKGNILQIIGTRRGERVMLPEFGSRILDYIHDPLDHITCALIRFELIQAIKRWEPRVKLDTANTRVIAVPENFSVTADLRYWLRDTGGADSISAEIRATGEVTSWRG